jgi:phosphate transport system permease protein
MSTRARAIRLPAFIGLRGGTGQSLGDGLLFGLCALGALVAIAVIAETGYQVISGAAPAISKFGLAFLTNQTWAPNFNRFGGAVFIFGTVVSSAMALVLAMPAGVAIAIYLAMLAGPRQRALIGPLVELIAAIPSVIVGLWGIIVMAPFIVQHVEPWLHNTFGFIPLFGPPSTSGASVFTGGLVLAIMIVPIIASLSRDLFLTVPAELQDGAAALGATRWEVIRGVVLPSTAPGVIAASVLGLGRALGEAIAVTQVIGAGSAIHGSLFETGDTLASKVAIQFPGNFPLFRSSLFYLALILLVIELIVNLFAQWLSRRFDTRRVHAI